MDEDPRIVTAGELRRMLDSSRPPIVVDVRLEDDLDYLRIPAAVGNCVYEVAFGERMPGIIPDLEAPVCVYGASSTSQESRMAAEKLCRLGYTNVLDLREGIHGWISAGFPAEGSGKMLPPPALPDGDYPVDLKESRIRWIGRNLLNRHEGFVSLKSGWLSIEGGRLARGSFVIDMRDISCLDLKGDSLHEVLIHHLLSHDFFDSTKFPEASFSITRANGVEDATPGSANLQVTGELTMKGATHVLSFPVAAGITPEGKGAAQANLSFDRTLWNVIYGSGKRFSNLGGHLVNDLVEIQLRIVTA